MIYADYNATTPLCTEAKDAVMLGLEEFGNPSSSHKMGQKAQKLLYQAREKVAFAAGVKPEALVFTSGGSEANSLALMGSYFGKTNPFRVVTTGVEHSSVRDTIKWMEGKGASILMLSVNSEGEINLDQVRKILEASEPEIVSIMAANNETGVLFPIPEIATICRELNIPLHVDAVQAFGKVPAETWKDVDFVSISAHKIYGPKGVGALLLPTGKQLVPTHYGGSQEVKRRGGTENLPGILGFGAAAERLTVAETATQIEALRDRFEERLLAQLDAISIQGSGTRRLSNTSNVRFAGISADVLLSALDLDGLYISAGSACSSGSISPSHVLLAMGLLPTEAKECVRFSWGRDSTAAQVDTAADLVVHHVRRIRVRHQSQA